MFIAAPFTIAKTQKQPKSPSTDEGKDEVCIDNGILLNPKREQNNASFSNTVVTRGCHVK